MIVGSQRLFAIEYDVVERVDEWVFGTFIFWIDGIPVGRASDESVHLKGCLMWLRHFLVDHDKSVDQPLFEMDIGSLFDTIFRGVISAYPDGHEGYDPVKQSYYERFHISHIGMSSFDALSIAVVGSLDGRYRFVWQSGSDPVSDAVIPMSEVHSVMSRAIEVLDAEIEAGASDQLMG